MVEWNVILEIDASIKIIDGYLKTVQMINRFNK